MGFVCEWFILFTEPMSFLFFFFFLSFFAVRCSLYKEERRAEVGKKTYHLFSRAEREASIQTEGHCPCHLLLEFTSRILGLSNAFVPNGSKDMAHPPHRVSAIKAKRCVKHLPTLHSVRRKRDTALQSRNLSFGR